MTNNQIMKTYLQKNVLAPLIEQGFTGKYPHFRRVKSNCIELLSVQTNKWGGSFIIEVSAVFPMAQNKNYVPWEGLIDDALTVWDTNERYRLDGMYDGWFYYRDVYSKYVFGFGRNYIQVSEKQSADFVPTKGYKLVQKFDIKTAESICVEVNKQLIKAFKWLSKFEKKNM